MTDTDRRMTKAERDDLVRLVKQRERLAKTTAEQRSLAMLADFEAKITATHTFATDEVWKAATEAAIESAKKANEEIAKRAADLGIPPEFQPSINFSWARRGENEYQGRREELRRLAKAEIAAIEHVARVEIERASVQAQSEIIAHGLTTEAALKFLSDLPPIESMMPALDITTIQTKLADNARKRPGYTGPRLIE